MASMLDIVGSFVIGGMVLLAVITLNRDMAGSAEQMTMDLMVQENMVELARTVEYDFHKIGYRVSNDTVITLADSTSITFLADIDDDGSVDIVQYYLGSPDELTSTPSTEDRLLYRVVNSETPKSSNLGVIAFGLTYYDESGDETSDLAVIQAIKVSLEVESPFPYSDTTFVAYAGLHWEEYIVPMNIHSE